MQRAFVVRVVRSTALRVKGTSRECLLWDDTLADAAGYIVREGIERVEIAASISASPASCSGDMYVGVPTVLPSIVMGLLADRVEFAIPRA